MTDRHDSSKHAMRISCLIRSDRVELELPILPLFSISTSITFYMYGS